MNNCRIRTKIESELVADINKAFEKFCNKHECHTCPCQGAACKLSYVVMLLTKTQDPEDDEQIGQRYAKAVEEGQRYHNDHMDENGNFRG